MKQILLQLLSIVILFASCAKEHNNDITGIPFQESEKGQWSMLTTEGTVLFANEFKQRPTVVKEGMFMVKNENNLWEIYTAEQKPKKVGGEYVNATLFQNGKALVVERNKPVTIINAEGNVVKVLDKIDNKTVGMVSAFSEGYATYQAGDDAGVIDENGNSVIPAKYCAIRSCSDGKFIAVDKKYKKMFDADSVSAIKYTVLDTSGKILFEISGSKYYSIGNFKDGYLPVCVKKEGETMWGIINEKQEVVVKPTTKLKRITEISGDKFIYSNGTGWGLMDIKGNTIIRAKYDGLAFDSNDRLMAYTKTDDGKGTFKFINDKDDQIGKDEYLSCTLFKWLDGEHSMVKITDTQ